MDAQRGYKQQNFYIAEDTDEVPPGSIICNGVEFEVVIKHKMLWKLLTPMAYIQALNTDNPPVILPPQKATSLAAA